MACRRDELFLVKKNATKKMLWTKVTNNNSTVLEFCMSAARNLEEQAQHGLEMEKNGV